MKYVCDNCDEVDETNTTIEEREETYNVKDEGPITVLAQVRVCKQCNKDIPDEDLDDKTLQAAYVLHGEGKATYKAT